MFTYYSRIPPILEACTKDSLNFVNYKHIYIPTQEFSVPTLTLQRLSI